MSKAKFVGAVISTIIAIIFQGFMWWFIKQPFDLHSSATWWEAVIFLGIMGCIWSAASSDCSNLKINFFAIAAFLVFVIFAFGYVGSTSAFTASYRYETVKSMVEVVEGTDGESAFPNLLGSNNDTSNLPLLGIPEAIKNAETQMGKQPALGSQFELIENELTSQNIDDSLMYVIPLEPKKWYKWDGNNHGYFVIDRNNGKTEFKEDGLITTEGAPFGSNAIRIIYKYMSANGISGRITELSPEITDEGEFKYVATVYTTKGIEGFKKVTGIVELDAATKSCQYYALEDVPEYVDRVFPEEFFKDYISYYGKYKNGWWNSLVGQKEVLEPTKGNDIVYIDGVCWYYSGFTSAGKGESSNGIIMMNCRTGEIKYYITYGISEEKAMGVAEGRVQEKGYKASYPLLLMVGGQETYFMLMRDENNNLCGYAFVSYKDYTKASVSETLLNAQSQYMKAISSSNSADILDNLDVSKGTAAITQIGYEVREGETVWYVMMEGNDHIFTVTSAVEPLIVFAKAGDIAEVSYVEAESQVVSAVDMAIKLSE